MNWSKSIGFAFALSVVYTMMPGAQVRTPAEGRDETTFQPQGEAVDLVIALDTSDSMEPLIEATRLKLWGIVNTVAFADPPPQLRVALLTYGNPANDAAQGWVRIETDLTADLDLVAERLFELDTGGGKEYVARVVQRAVNELSWSTSWEAIKLVFVAGNESAEQDPDVSLLLAGDSALANGIVVNTFYCGGADQPDAAMWKVLAEQSAGKFAAIDPRIGLVVTTTPFDDELARLSRELNRTFVPLGEIGQKRLESVAVLDQNASRLGSATAAARARTKSLPRFSWGWDLISSLESGPINAVDIDLSELPKEIQHLSAAELEIHLEDLRVRRHELQRKVKELSVLRRRHIVAGIEAGAIRSSQEGLERTMHEVLREILENRGFRLTE